MRLIPKLIFLLICVIPQIAFTQISLPQAPKNEPAPIPETLESPRATLSTFFDAMNETPPNYEKATTTFDLSEIPQLIHDTQGTSLSSQLFGIFNRSKFIVLNNISNSPDSPEVSIDLRNSKTPELANIPPVVLRKSTDGAWRFSTNTVAHIPQTWQTVKDLPVIKNLKDIVPTDSIYVDWANRNLPQDWINPGFLGLAPWKWIGILISAVAGYLVGLVIRIVAKLIIRLRTGRFGSEMSKATLDSAGHGFSLLTNGTVFAAFALGLQLTPDIKAAAMFFALILQTVGCAWLAMAIIEFAVNRLTPKIADADRAERLFLPILRNLGRIVVIIIALLFFLERVGFNVTGLIAGLGLGGLVVALAAMYCVENVLGSLTLIFEMPFQIGDWVISNGIEGTVEEISLRSTTLRTFHDSTILVPNSKFISSPIENMGRRRYRRLKTTIGITYDATADQIEEFVTKLRAYILEHPKTWDDKINIALNDYSPSSLNILFIVFIEANTFNDELLIREELLLGIMRIAQECGVHFAFPTQKMIIDTDKSTASMRLLTDE